MSTPLVFFLHRKSKPKDFSITRLVSLHTLPRSYSGEAEHVTKRELLICGSQLGGTTAHSRTCTVWTLLSSPHPDSGRRWAEEMCLPVRGQLPSAKLSADKKLANTFCFSICSPFVLFLSWLRNFVEKERGYLTDPSRTSSKQLIPITLAEKLGALSIFSKRVMRAEMYKSHQRDVGSQVRAIPN